MEPTNLNSLTKTNTIKSSNEDSDTPFSFLEWSARTSLYKQEEAFPRYNEYLQEWFNANKTTTVSTKFKLRQKYLYLLDQLKLTFETKDKNEWYKTVDLADENELLLAIPFFARKLKNLALYYLNARKKVKKSNLINNSKGSNLGLEQVVKDYVLDYFAETANEDSNSTIKSIQVTDNIKNKLVVQIEELYDDGNYLDLSPSVPISEYIKSNQEDINLLKSKNIDFSFLEKLIQQFNIDISVDYDSFVSTLTGNLFEVTTQETYDEFINKYLGTEKLKVTFQDSVKSSYEQTFNVAITQGNNFFYYPYGTGTIKDFKQPVYNAVPLSSINFKNFATNLNSTDKPTAGTSLEDSDVIIARAENEVKAAWLYYQEYENLAEAKSVMLFKANETTTFKFPFPGYGLSGFNVNWTGPSYSYTPNFNFLADDTRNAILDAYWNSSLPIDKIDTLELNQCRFADSGATASIHPQHADRIYITKEKSADPSNPFTKPAGAWLYKNTHTQLPVIPNKDNLILWPYTNLSTNKDSISGIAYEVNSISKISPNNIGDRLSLSSLQTPFFVAASNIDEADKIYKINSQGLKNRSTYAEVPIEVAWLSGQTVETDTFSYVAQRGFNALFEPGKQTKFLWTGPNDTLLLQVFPTIEHRKDCPFVTNVPKDAKTQWTNCSCKQVYYTPHGHNNPTYQSDGNRSADYIISLDTPDEVQVDLNSWTDVYGNLSYNSDTQFAWYQTKNQPGWGEGNWVTNSGAAPFRLETGKTYLYYRHGAPEAEPPLVAKYAFPQNQENTVWISAKLNSLNGWESTNTPSAMSLNPGDVVRISPVESSTFNVLSTFLDPSTNLFHSPNSFTVPGYTADLITRYTLAEKDSTLLTNPDAFNNINGRPGNVGYPNDFSNNYVTGEGCENLKSLWSTYDLIPVVCFKQNGTSLHWPITNDITDLVKYAKQIPRITGTLDLAGLDEVLTLEKIKKIKWVVTDLTKKSKKASYEIENTFNFNFVPPTAGIYQVRVYFQFNDPLGYEIDFALTKAQKLETTSTTKVPSTLNNQPVVCVAETKPTVTPAVKPAYKLVEGTQSNIVPKGWDRNKPVYCFTGIPNIVAIEPTPYTAQGKLIDKAGLTKDNILEIIGTNYTDSAPLSLRTNINFRKPTSENVWKDLYITTKTSVNIPRPGFLLEEQLYGWDYNLNKRRPNAKGHRPYWASLDVEKNSTTRFKAIYDWGYPDKYINGYLPNNQPEFSHLELNSGDVIEYHRKGSNYECTQPITPYKFVDKYRWCKVNVDLTQYSNLASLFASKQTFEPVAIPTYEDTDIILSDIINTYPLGIYYYALGDFIWNIKAIPLSADTSASTIVNISSAYTPLSPWENLANKFYPNVAMVPLLQDTYSKKDVGGFFVPNNLGASVFINKNFTPTLKPLSSAQTSYIVNDNKTLIEGIGTTKQTQMSIYSWEENNEWLKEPSVVNDLAGAPRRSLTKTLQTFTPYESNTAETSLGLITLDTKMSPWGGKDDGEWIDKENKIQSFTGIINVSAWNATQITKEYETQTESWVSDVFGNQYQLLKKNIEQIPFADRKNVGGTLWIKTNAGKVVSAASLLSSTVLPLETQLDLFNDATQNEQMLEMDCFYNVLFIKTPTAAAYFTLFYSYEMDTISTTIDYTRIIPINDTYRFEKNWFLQNEKKVISLFTQINTTSFIPELWETDIQTLDTRRIYPSNQAEREELIDALLEIDMKDLQPGCMSYNKEENTFLLTYVGNNLSGSLVVADFTIQRDVQAQLLKIDFYTNLYFDNIAGNSPQVHREFLREITTASPFTITLSTLYNPTQCNILNQDTVTATITNPNTIVVAGSLPQGIHQIVYELSNLVGSVTYPLTLNVV